MLSASNVVSGNLLSGNAKAGLGVGPAASNTVIQGNKVGTDASGNYSIANLNYGAIVQSGFNTIGGSYLDGTGNLFSGNQRHGLILLGETASNNMVKGNFSGTNFDATLAIPNTSYGIYVLQGDDNTIGGTATGEGNVVSGNQRSGIVLEVGANGNDVIGNHVGTSMDGFIGIGNTNAGILLTTGASDNTIDQNQVAGNGGIGIALINDGTEDNTVTSNIIGASVDGSFEIGNGAFAVFVSSANNHIGTPSAGM